MWNEFLKDPAEQDERSTALFASIALLQTATGNVSFFGQRFSQEYSSTWKPWAKIYFFTSVPSILMESMNGCLQLITFHRLFTSLFSPAGFIISGWYWSRRLGHFRLWPPSWTDWHTWPQFHDGIDPMQDTINLENLKPFYCEFQKFEVMTMPVVGGQKNTQIPIIKQQNTSSALRVVSNFGEREESGRNTWRARDSKDA